MAKYEPLFKRTQVTFRERFPNIDTYKVRIEQDRYGHFARDGKPTIDMYSEQNNLPATVRCVNPRCQRGGLQLELFMDLVKKGEPFTYKNEFFCGGDEGTPAGRKTGDRCGNIFFVEITANTPKT